MMNDLLNLVKHKNKKSEETINEINNWVSLCMKRSDEIEAFAAVIVLKDGSVDTYDESSTARNRLTLVGGIDALKADIIRKHYEFQED
jgi:hypothetical protein